MITSVRTGRQQTTRQSTARVGRLVVVGDRSEIPVSDELAAYILRQYQPKQPVDTAVLGWARRLVLESRPTSRDDARILIRRICLLGAWLRGIGYTLDEPTQDLLDDSLIHAYVEASDFGAGTRQTMVSAFRRVRHATSPDFKVVFSSTRTDVESAVLPVTDAEVHAFQRWVEGIDTQHNLHHDGLLLVAFLRGGGCTKPDLDRIESASIRAAGGGNVAFDITGPASRTVTVDRHWASVLRPFLAVHSEGSPFDRDGVARRGSVCLKNLENFYYWQRNRLDEKGKRSLPGFLNVNTYRAAWMVDRLERSQRLDLLLAEAGLVSAAGLDRYLQFLPDSMAPRRAAS
ncbi:MAG: hypothetical protein JWP40_3744 [Blastococcus sp.]|nr:hypothetical protein [Blastococcus sp.]